PVLFGQRFIAPVVRDYLDTYPQVTAEMMLVDRIVDLIDEGLDVAVRIGDLPDSSLTATSVGNLRLVTVAAPEYLAKLGMPSEPAELSHHRIILPVGATGLRDWRFVTASDSQTLRLQPALTVNTMIAAIDAASAGWGITRAISYQVADELASGALVEILAEWDDRSLPIHLVHSEGRRATAKIRAFVDMAATVLRRDSARLSAR
ncbi:MAG: LysR substrate-binding domain-containing protein, partial [Pseudomonadota bacterium]